MPRVFSSVIAVLVLAAAVGCQSVATHSDQTDPKQAAGGELAPRPEACAAEGFRHLIGQAASAADAVPDPKRVIRPGQAVTKDYRPERTNISLDAQGVIRRLSCG